MPDLKTVTGWFHPGSLFSIHRKVGGLEYFTVGVGLALIKYLVEATVIGLTTGSIYLPLDFINPFLTGREKFLMNGPEWLGFAWLIWTFPFLVVCVLMSIRRCFDAGISPWYSFVSLVPVLNLAGMPFLAVIPTSDSSNVEANPYAVSSTLVSDPIERPSTSSWEAGLVGLVSGAVYLVLSFLFCVNVIGSYGTALFFGAPIVTCACSAYWLNRRIRVSLSKTISHSILLLLVASLGFLALGIEGGICILMAMPIFIPMAILGAIVGYAIAASSSYVKDHHTGMYGSLLSLPLLACGERWMPESPTLEARSEIVIQASIETVWSNVIAFPDIETKPRGLFAWGVSYPIRARIEGYGVGAIRYCEFTTGTFVEPITNWDAPNRLAFDVTDQPEPMTELSPYKSIHPPHLHGFFRSLRGEFRLVEREDGTTLLQGSTWYQLDIGPRCYWRIWTDAIVHRIHLRVLEHIRTLAENPLTALDLQR